MTASHWIPTQSPEQQSLPTQDDRIPEVSLKILALNPIRAALSTSEHEGVVWACERWNRDKMVKILKTHEGFGIFLMWVLIWLMEINDGVLGFQESDMKVYRKKKGVKKV